MTGARPFAALLLSALLAACASSGDYPSLAQRPAERAQGSFATDPAQVVPLPPPAPSADLVARLEVVPALVVLIPRPGRESQRLQ